MIKASELRIGNLVSIPSLNRIGKVISFTNRNVKVKLPDSTVSITTNKGFDGLDIDPIEITTEWLLKEGFKTIGHSKDYRKKSIILHTRKRGLVVRKSVPIMQYVHQLQNYCFTNTGTELL